MRVLFVSTLFPNACHPTFGVFNLQEIRELAALASVRVVAPIESPFGFGRWGGPRAIPLSETIAGLPVMHPRSFYLPKVGRTLNPLLYAASIAGTIAEIRRSFAFDVVFVNWLYPDACGLGILARRLRVPYVVGVLGSDANQYLRYRVRRRQILRALDRSRRIVTVSVALRDLLVSHGVSPDAVRVLYNGVDRERFRPMDRLEACRGLGIPADVKRILFVGGFIPVKNLRRLVDAFSVLRARRPELAVELVLAGDGPQRAELAAHADRLGLASAVRMTPGRIGHGDVAAWMNASDVLCLPSLSEGMPNVVLEALACGVPVVASNVGGVPEIVQPGVTGLLTSPTDTAALGQALAEAVERPWDRAHIRAQTAAYDWRLKAAMLRDTLLAAVA